MNLERKGEIIVIIGVTWMIIYFFIMGNFWIDNIPLPEQISSLQPMLRFLIVYIIPIVPLPAIGGIITLVGRYKNQVKKLKENYRLNKEE